MERDQGAEEMGNGERLETDKLTHEFTFRIPEILKVEVDRLSKYHKRRLNERLLVTIAAVVHEAKFDPRRYLQTEYGIDGDGAR